MNDHHDRAIKDFDIRIKDAVKDAEVRIMQQMGVFKDSVVTALKNRATNEDLYKLDVKHTKAIAELSDRHEAGLLAVHTDTKAIFQRLSALEGTYKSTP